MLQNVVVQEYDLKLAVNKSVSSCQGRRSYLTDLKLVVVTVILVTSENLHYFLYHWCLICEPQEFIQQVCEEWLGTQVCSY